MDALAPPNAAPFLNPPNTPDDPMPLRDGGARVEGRVCADIADAGRLGSLEAAVVGLIPAVARSVVELSPSSEAISVMREDIILGALKEPEGDKGFGKELFAEERVDGFAIGES